MFKPAPKGERKMKHAAQMAGYIFVGFVAAAWLKVDAQLFGTFVAGIGGVSGFFIWGNRAEHVGKPTDAIPKPAAG
jgi:hypothetical protein